MAIAKQRPLDEVLDMYIKLSEEVRGLQFSKRFEDLEILGWIHHGEHKVNIVIKILKWHMMHYTTYCTLCNYIRLRLRNNCT